MNAFLKNLDITFRRDPTNYRPRINKMNSLKDQEQKAAGARRSRSQAELRRTSAPLQVQGCSALARAACTRTLDTPCTFASHSMCVRMRERTLCSLQTVTTLYTPVLCDSVHCHVSPVESVLNLGQQGL